MRKKLLCYSLLGSLGITSHVFAQRYTSNVTENVTVTDDVVYGQNVSIITGSAKAEDLKMTVYQPSGDTATNRPLVIYLHTGNFLPKGVNKATTGERQDKCVVEMCTQLARRGFVAAAISYRIGWNPLSNIQDARTSTLIQAVYRAIQDAKTSVRYFKKNSMDGGNNFGIDPNNIMLLGQGSGAYVALAYATLNDPAEINLDKFTDFNQTPTKPFVDTTVLGNFDGYNGDPGWNIENHKGYSNDIKMIVNLGGAIGDSIWLEKGDVPMVSFHCPSDPSAPYKYGTVVVPTIGPVVDVNGNYDVIRLANQAGNNDIFKNANYTDAYTVAANKINDGYEGLFPFYVAKPPQSAPWEWWDAKDAMHSISLGTNPDMSREKGLAYIDTIMGYMIPRVMTVLNLKSEPAYNTGVTEKTSVVKTISLYPNPTDDVVTLSSTTENTLNSVSIVDITGKTVFTTKNTGKQSISINVKSLSPGIYFVSANDGITSYTTKLIVN